MEQHGKSLAAAHKLTSRRGPDQLLPRLAANEAVLIDTCNLLMAAVRANRRIAPAGEWLLDNFYLIEEQIRTAKRHLPKDYSRELPRLASGPSRGLPRVYDIALETIAHGDGRVDPESLSRFVAAYQTVTTATLGELWAIPIMLRLALIENLRRVATDVAAATVDRDLADGWADQMKAIVQTDPKSLILVIADMARSDPPMTTAFVSELSRRLQGHGPALALPLTWIEQRLSESHLTIEQLVQSGTQQQAANQVSISNSIGSLRFLGAMDWRKFVETMSVVEQKLLEDPSGSYGSMDFVTRDQYRHAVEQLAKNSPLSEVEVARRAIQFSHESASRSDADPRAAHVGFYLIDAGRPLLERAVDVRRSSVAALTRLAARCPSFVYLGAILTLTGLFSAGMIAMARANGLSDPMLAAVVVAFAAGDQSIVGCAGELVPDVARDTAPAAANGLLAGHPAGIAHAGGGPRDACQPERDRRSRRSPGSPFPGQPGCEPALRIADGFRRRERGNAARGRAAVAAGAGKDQRAEREVRGKYRTAAATARTRLPATSSTCSIVPASGIRASASGWATSASGGSWATSTRSCAAPSDATKRFSLIVGDTAALTGVKYVITLDTDTELPRDAARQLAGAMAHPLNRAALRRHAAAGHHRIRHPAASRRGELARIQPVVVLAHFRG